MKRNGIRLCKTGLAGCLAALWVGSVCRAEESRTEDATAELMRRGTESERAGRTAEATAAYEKLLQRDTSYEAILSPRLVDLYIADGQPGPALSWAGRVARRHPDPQAYLAGVHARLGQWKEAEILLRRALSATDEPRKRLLLLWQLADAQEGQGDGVAARETLSGACDTTRDEALRKTSSQRLAALQQRLKTPQTNRPQTPAEPKTEARP